MAVTVEAVRASKWTVTCLDFRGGWQRRWRCCDHADLERVVTGMRGRPTSVRYHVYGIEIGRTIDEAVAALNDWSIVQRILDAESAHNNVDDGDLHGRSRRMSKPPPSLTHDPDAVYEQVSAFVAKQDPLPAQLGFGF